MIPVAGYWLGEPWFEEPLVRNVVAYEDADPFGGYHVDELGNGVALLRNAAEAPAPKARAPRKRPRRHPGVDFVVGDQTFKRGDQALAFAAELSLANGSDVPVDVLVYTPAGAKWYRGDDGVTEYKEDPEASVFERLEIRARSYGRIQ